MAKFHKIEIVAYVPESALNLTRAMNLLTDLVEIDPRVRFAYVRFMTSIEADERDFVKKMASRTRAVT